MHVAQLSPRFDLVRRLGAAGTREAVDAAREISRDIGEVLVAGAVQGGVAMPDPTCGGSSLETIPTPLTPVVSKADMLSRADLPALRAGLEVALATVARLEQSAAPRTGVEVEVLREKLGVAMKTIG